MLSRWEWVTFVLETLAMKLARIDEDGLDLVFTSGEEYNLWDSHDASDFKLGMEKAEPKMESPKTDMSVCLGKLTREYLEGGKYLSKALTLIVLTDGKWGVPASSSREDRTAKKIVDFVNALIKTAGRSKVEDRWFSIQFISFADTADDYDYLKGLDSRLWKKNNIP